MGDTKRCSTYCFCCLCAAIPQNSPRRAPRAVLLHFPTVVAAFGPRKPEIGLVIV